MCSWIFRSKLCNLTVFVLFVLLDTFAKRTETSSSKGVLVGRSFTGLAPGPSVQMVLGRFVKDQIGV